MERDHLTVWETPCILSNTVCSSHFSCNLCDICFSGSGMWSQKKTLCQIIWWTYYLPTWIQSMSSTAHFLKKLNRDWLCGKIHIHTNVRSLNVKDFVVSYHKYNHIQMHEFGKPLLSDFIYRKDIWFQSIKPSKGLWKGGGSRYPKYSNFRRLISYIPISEG